MQELINLFIPSAFAADPVGQVTLPAFWVLGNVDGKLGVGFLLGSILRIIFTIGGIFALFNFILGGFGYISGAGDAKKLQSSWDRIWYSLLGLIVMVGSFALAAILGQLLFNDPSALITPRVATP